jgi:hypothetical protein
MKLLQMMNGYRVMQALYAAAALGLADLLAEGPRHSDDLAQAAAAHPPSLRRLLRALASLEVVAETTGGRFALTPLGACLRSGVPGSLRAAAIFFGDKRHWSAWGKLVDSVRTGETVWGPRSGQAFFEMAARDPQGAAIFNDAMTSMTGVLNAAVVDAYDFSGIGVLVDVGGGHGALLCGILAANPDLRGIVFDIAPVIEGTRARIAAAGLGGRCEAVAGDCFRSVPRGDAYILKAIIHDWTDELSIAILANCRRAMAAGGRLLLAERVVPERIDATPETQGAVLGDLNMLLLSGGCERTEDEYRVLLSAAGLRLARVVPTASPLSLIEAVPT